MRSFTPFTFDDEIVAVVNGFLDRSLPKASWTHATHFSTTLWIIKCRNDLDAARAFLEDNLDESLHGTCNALMRSALGEPDWLLAYWSRRWLFSVAARRSWVAPDIKAPAVLPSRRGWHGTCFIHGGNT